jgi:uncharacterized protein YjbJ (UPF0337 family)
VGSVTCSLPRRYFDYETLVTKTGIRNGWCFVGRRVGRRGAMSGADKARNKLEQVRGKVKAAWGRATNDPELKAQGRADQRVSHLKDAGEKVKDAFRPRRRG